METDFLTSFKASSEQLKHASNMFWWFIDCGEPNGCPKNVAFEEIRSLKLPDISKQDIKTASQFP